MLEIGCHYGSLPTRKERVMEQRTSSRSWPSERSTLLCGVLLPRCVLSKLLLEIVIIFLSNKDHSLFLAKKKNPPLTHMVRLTPKIALKIYGVAL